MASAKVKRISPMLAVADMDEAVAFNEIVLGFHCDPASAGLFHYGARWSETIHFMKAASEEVLRCVRVHVVVRPKC